MWLWDYSIVMVQNLNRIWYVLLISRLHGDGLDNDINYLLMTIPFNITRTVNYSLMNGSVHCIIALITGSIL